MTAAAAPANEPGAPVRSATCRARFSAITLLLSRSIQLTIADRCGEWTLAIVTACAGAVVVAARPSTRMPRARRKAAKAPAASAAGVKERARKLSGSSASCGLPARVSLPWSTSSAVIGVTLPVVT